jgi:hypothetical protein
VIQSIDDINLSFDIIQPDLHCQTFGILRANRSIRQIGTKK